MSTRSSTDKLFFYSSEDPKVWVYSVDVQGVPHVAVRVEGQAPVMFTEEQAVAIEQGLLRYRCRLE